MCRLFLPLFIISVVTARPEPSRVTRRRAPQQTVVTRPNVVPVGTRPRRRDSITEIPAPKIADWQIPSNARFDGSNIVHISPSIDEIPQWQIPPIGHHLYFDEFGRPLGGPPADIYKEPTEYIHMSLKPKADPETQETTQETRRNRHQPAIPATPVLESYEPPEPYPVQGNAIITSQEFVPAQTWPQVIMADDWEDEYDEENNSDNYYYYTR